MSVKNFFEHLFVGKNSMRGALTVGLVSFILLYISCISFFGTKAPSDVIYTILGALLAKLSDISNYYFGSSQSSNDKDKVITDKLTNG